MPTARLDVSAGVRWPASPGAAWSDGALWNREYGEVRAIPSSLRHLPSRAFRRLARSIGDLSGARVLDLGAGTGRHAIYAARHGATVHAVDASDVACEILRERARAAGCPSSISVEHGAVDVDALPSGRFDLVIDSYATCHILAPAARLALLTSLMTRLTLRGKLYTAGMGDADAFYRHHLVGPPASRIAVDPENGITKLLQTPQTAIHDGAHIGRLIATTTEKFTDRILDAPYRREVHATLLGR